MCVFTRYVRWARTVIFTNWWGQRDGLYDVFWALNIALYASAGFAIVRAQHAPCFFESWVAAAACLGLDLNYVVFNLYCRVAHSLRVGNVDAVQRFVVEALVNMLVPMGGLAYVCSSD
jgi:hypothetical protein